MAKAQAQVDVNSASHIVQAEQDWLDAYGKAEFDDSRLPSILSNQLTDIYEATYGISSNVNRAEIITANVVGGSGVFADRVLHNMANEIRKRITSLNDQAGVMRANVETVWRIIWAPTLPTTIWSLQAWRNTGSMSRS